MWSDLVVVLPPARNARPGLVQRFKPLLIQAFIPELSVEALDVAVLHWLARFNQDVAYPVLVCPGQERTAGELRAIICTHRCRIAPKPCHLVQHTGDVLARDAVVHRNLQGLFAEVVHHRQALLKIH